MDVLIQLERKEPPAGTVLRLREDERRSSDPGEPLAFVGWLGLLRALSEVVEAGEPAAG